METEKKSIADVQSTDSKAYIGIKESPLGREIEAPSEYDPTILFAFPRQPMRAELGISGSNPFYGMDFWNA